MLDFEQQVCLGAKLLKISVEEFGEMAFYVEDLKATHFVHPVKGGFSLLIGEDGSVLYGNSSFSYERLVQKFKEGVRTPLSAFGFDDGD